MRDKATNLADEERDDMMYSCQQAVQAIHNWKAHQLRVLQQDRCRIDVLQELSLNDSEVLITQDWAMKFLPQKYRETQTDWFEKRGISWYISVAVRRNTEGKLAGTSSFCSHCEELFTGQQRRCSYYGAYSP